MEVGDYDIDDGELDPKNRRYYVRTISPTHLEPGSQIGLSDYTNFAFYVFVKDSTGEYRGSSVNTSVYTATVSGDYMVTVRANPLDTSVSYSSAKDIGVNVLIVNSKSIGKRLDAAEDTLEKVIYYPDKSFYGLANDGKMYVSFEQILNNGFNRSNGTFPNENSWDRTSFIKVFPGEIIHISNTVRSHPYNGWYTDDKTYINDFTIPVGENIEITVPSEAGFMILTNAHAAFNYIIWRESNWFASKQEVNSLIGMSKNLLTTFVNGSVDTDTGVFTELSSGVSYAATKEMISVKPSTTYSISWNEPIVKPAYAFIYEYTISGTYIKRVSFSVFEYYKNYSYVTSDNCEKIRLGLIRQNETWSNIVPSEMQFEEGPAVTAYVDHKTINPNLIDPDKQFSRLVKDKTLRYDFYVPDYYMANGYLDNKIDAINTYMDSCYSNGDCFIFITDAHWEYNAKNSPALIRYLHDRTGIAKVFDGGDVANGGNDDFMEYCQTLQAAIWKNAYFAIGNHEPFGGVSSSYISNRFDKYHDDYKGNPDQHYYYVDNDRAKIRYIVLACYEPGDGNNAFNGIGGSSVASQAQRDWLRDVALNVDDEWGCVIVMHSLYYVSNIDPYPLVTETRYNSTIEIMDNFVAGGGTIICILQGHTHIDRMTKTPGGIPVFITCCDKYYDNENPPGILVPRTLGTIREQAFDAVCINKTAKEVKLIRIGCPAQNGFGDSVGIEAEERTLSYAQTD